MEPNWYYSHTGEKGQFVAFADANNSCSMRVFAEENGDFIRHESAGVAGASFATHYRKEIKQMERIGPLSKRPNLQDAVAKKRLPSDILSELKRLKRSLIG